MPDEQEEVTTAGKYFCVRRFTDMADADNQETDIGGAGTALART